MCCSISCSLNFLWSWYGNLKKIPFISFATLCLWSLHFISCMHGFIFLTHEVCVLPGKTELVSMRCAAAVIFSSVYISVCLWCYFIYFSLSICHCWWCAYSNLSIWWYLWGASNKPDHIFVPLLFTIFWFTICQCQWCWKTDIFFWNIGSNFC